MGRLQTILVTAIALFIIYLFIIQARSMGAPNVFVLVGALMVVLIVINVGKTILRGY
jgi:hypothetical protein